MFAQLLDFIVSNTCLMSILLILDEKSLQYFGQYLKVTVMLLPTQITLKSSEHFINAVVSFVSSD